MAQTTINLIIRAITGTLGGVAAGAVAKEYGVTTWGNVITAAIGGVVGGRVIELLMDGIENLGTGPGRVQTPSNRDSTIPGLRVHRF